MRKTFWFVTCLACLSCHGASSWAQTAPASGSLLGSRPAEQNSPEKKQVPAASSSQASHSNKQPAAAPTAPVKPAPAAATAGNSASSMAQNKAASAAPGKAAAGAHGKAATTSAAQAEPLPLPPPPPPAAPPVGVASTAEPLPEPEKPENAPAKLPRFASLRSDDVNLRAGPGVRYRIEWVYKRRELPVEIEREFDVWRYVRDADGVQGWMQQATLMGRRTFIVQHNAATMRAEPSDSARAVAVLEPGVIGRIRLCEAASAWCQVQSGSYRGYLRRDQFWGTLPSEAIGP